MRMTLYMCAMLLVGGCGFQPHRSGLPQTGATPGSSARSVEQKTTDQSARSTDNISPGSSARNAEKKTADQPARSIDNLVTQVKSMGSPISFEQAFNEIQPIPRFKGEFETAAQFQQRQADARTGRRERYLIATPVDPERVRYDADQQLLLVTVYALTNVRTSQDELYAMFGWSSELDKAGVEIEYGSITSSRIEWAFPRERRVTGNYDGQNAFGVTATIVQEEMTATGIFERQGDRGGGVLDGEDVWFRRQPRDVEVSLRSAFQIKANVDRARALKQPGGLRAAVLVAPRFPFYATGVDRKTPTISSPIDRTTNVRYIIGDIQAVALYDASGRLIAVRESR